MRSASNSASPARKQLERRLAPLRKLELARPPRGWIKAIREALGMTSAQLGQRIGVSQSRVTRIEKDEAGDAVTLTTLRKTAAGLNCTLVYALVPHETLDEMVRARARTAADTQLARTHHSMKLENQALEERDLEAERERLAADILAGDLRRLWDGP